MKLNIFARPILKLKIEFNVKTRRKEGKKSEKKSGKSSSSDNKSGINLKKE